jgi:hypothetical protein
VVEQGATLESVVQKLEVANKERDKALADLEALRSCLLTENYFPETEDKLSWLGWVHRLSDRGYMVSTAMRVLQETAATSVEQADAVNASLERFKMISARPVGGPTECTTWGDIDQMLELQTITRMLGPGRSIGHWKWRKGGCNIIYSPHIS